MQIERGSQQREFAVKSRSLHVPPRRSAACSDRNESDEGLDAESAEDFGAHLLLARHARVRQHDGQDLGGVQLVLVELLVPQTSLHHSHAHTHKKTHSVSTQRP